MSNRKSMIVLLAASATMLASSVYLVAQSNAPKPVTAAVVDVQKVFNSLDEKKAVEADITAQTEKIQKEDQDKQTQLKALDADLRILAPNSEAYMQTREKLEKAAIEFQAWKQFQQRKLESENVLRIEALYRKMVETIERMAKKNGYDLVLFKDQTEQLRGQNIQQLLTAIQVRKVLYSANELDVTDALLQMCNNEFNARKAAAPAAPAKK